MTSSRSSLMVVYKEWQKILEGYREKLVKLNKTQSLAIDVIRTYFTGEELNGEVSKSFVGVWESIIRRKEKEGSVGTAENYQWALNSFRKLVGNPRGFKVDKNVIAKWNDAMKNGVMIDGKLVAIDGTKVKANNSRKNNVTISKLNKMIEHHEENIHEYLKQLSQNDIAESTDTIKSKLKKAQIKK